MSSKNRIISVITLFFILGFFIYGNVINGKFFLDDSVNIVANNYIRGFTHLKEIFSQDSVAGSGFHLPWYRPMLLLSYAVDYSLWGLNPIGYHVVNILLHIFSAVLLFFIVLKLFKKTSIAFLSGFIFLIHPVQTEAVSYVSGRADLLLVFFLLISFFSFLYLTDTSNTKNKAKFLFISLTTFILAMLSKETAVIFPALLVLYCLALKHEGYKISKSELLLLAPYAVLATVYQILRITILNFNNTYSSFGQDLAYRILMFFKTLPLYWQKLVWPINLRYHYETQLPIKHLDPQVIISILIIILLVILLKFYRVHRKLLLFGFGWFFISMGPASGILIPINFIIGERWLYLSAIGLFIVIAVLIVKLLDYLSQYKTWKTIIILLLIAYASFLIILGIKRNLVWRDGLTFAKNTLAYAPQESKIHGLLASEYVKREQDKEALEEFRIAIFLDPKDPTYIYNLGVLYANRDFDAETMNEFDEIIRLSTVMPTAFSALANRYAARKDYSKAVMLLEKITELIPDSWQAYSKLGEYYFLNNQKEQAIIALEEALTLNPDNEDIRTMLVMLKKQSQK